MWSKRFAAAVAATTVLAGALASPIQAQTPSSNYKNPETGEDCVQPAGQTTTDTHVEVRFHNSCKLSLVIEYRTTTGKSGSNGFDDQGDSHFTIANVDYVGFTWWVR